MDSSSQQRHKVKQIVAKPSKKKLRSYHLADNSPMMQTKYRREVKNEPSSLNINEISKKYIDSSLYESGRSSDKRIHQLVKRNNHEFSNIFEENKYPSLDPSILKVESISKSNRDDDSLNMTYIFQGLYRNRDDNAHPSTFKDTSSKNLY